MEKDIAALEIRSKSLNLVVGNALDNKVNVVSRIVRPLSVPLQNGMVIDSVSLSNDIKNILKIEDKIHNLQININEVSLVLPAFGLEVYNSQKSTNTISNTSKVDRIDISNALSLVRKEKIPNPNNFIADIIPNYFVIDGDKNFTEPPLGETSSSLSIDANIYTLPIGIVSELTKAVENAGVDIRRSIIAPIGASQLFSAYNFNYSTYILVDCGRKNTTLSFVGNNTVYSSVYFTFGVDDLVDRVVNVFNILRSDAEQLVNLYGYDERKSTLNPAIGHYKYNGESKPIFMEDLNKIVAGYFKDWLDYFKVSYADLMKPYNDIANDKKIVFIGEATKTNHFKKYINNFYGDRAEFPIIPSIGIQDSEFINCAGAILISSIYRGTLEDDIHGKINEVTREEEKEYKETKDEL